MPAANPAQPKRRRRARRRSEMVRKAKVEFDERPPDDFDPKNPYGDPVVMLEYREHLVREKSIQIETAKIIRDRLRWCYHIEGVNHLLCLLVTPPPPPSTFQDRSGQIHRCRTRIRASSSSSLSPTIGSASSSPDPGFLFLVVVVDHRLSLILTRSRGQAAPLVSPTVRRTAVLGAPRVAAQLSSSTDDEVLDDATDYGEKDDVREEVPTE